ncbi:phosphonoacetaldehyde reductase [Lachnobacterium bovis]|uniref:Alcohol dehydrogenase, class IV n=1 Tax=Lachnobacterium bovis TaxID=140626 RepID=A0A1H9T4K3_9FIRM|nr:phosphonoacetaldehyde reductase [Lachnobacterium bovis]SER92066.1 Alcohol dehydrogenase, class IV [Lachnobacterium bovis]
MGQKIIKIKTEEKESDYSKLCEILEKWISTKSKVMIVTLRSIKRYPKILQLMEKTKSVHFTDFTPNPTYEEVMKAYEQFKKEKCDSLIAIGGGSAMDVAKCIKFYNLDKENVPFLAVPTTAGTGSEATKFAVIYKDGNKLSIEDERCIPKEVIFDYHFLENLPIYQKKVTMMDAFCHALESFWSVNGNQESHCYSHDALETILEYMDDYLNENADLKKKEIAYKKMFEASYFAGKAINIAKTTAGHAMCYKITSMYGLAHGHATILCNRIIFRWMVENIDDLECIDKRGKEYTKDILKEIANVFKVDTLEEACNKLDMIFDKLDLEIPEVTEEQIEELISSVNADRMKNHPFIVTDKNLDILYKKILNYDIISY